MAAPRALVKQDLGSSSLMALNDCYIPPLCFRGPPFHSMVVYVCYQGLQKVLLVRCMKDKSGCSGMNSLGPCEFNKVGLKHEVYSH